MINEKLTKPYNPLETEKRIYSLWEENNSFSPASDGKKPFTIVMPPPNATGILHMGHALMLTIEDIIIRYKRMAGFNSLWIPGTDHAAIATQSRVEKDILKKEGKTRHDLGREEFLKKVNAFAQESRATIISQIKAMGASCDWSREAFTLDEKRSLAVRTIFKDMYEDGLIYRGNRIINWDPKGQTTISDDEIVYEEKKATLFTFRYSKEFPIPIATTRPETKLGDTGVAVHPDGKWKEYIGRTFEIKDFAGAILSIKIVGDASVDQEFGTGAIGITPAHSVIDWEIAERHNLDKTRIIINEYARMKDASPLVDGKKTSEARIYIIDWLKSNNLLEKEEEITHNIATAERTGGIIEPMPKLQWFINVNKPISKRNGMSLKELMRRPVESNEIKILPEHFKKTYFHWIENLRDWCISRQIWYGHRLPVWYNENNEIYVGIESPKETGWTQDPDTLDTWFSSGLWTFSVLGWPEKTKDLELYHPTDILETGYEILFFWVARMILMSEYALGEIPFKTVYLHGTVRDSKGRKMSKSLGNGIDPIEIAKKFGADAGRMALIIGNTPGTDTNISEDKIKAYKHFANKIWNIARFVFENTQDIKANKDFASFVGSDEEILKEVNNLLSDITEDLEHLRFHLVAEKLYHYIWHTFADKIIEDSKKIFTENKKEATISRKHLLLRAFEDLLRALHPFMPFITEEIWRISSHNTLLITERWPINN